MPARMAVLHTKCNLNSAVHDIDFSTMAEVATPQRFTREEEVEEHRRERRDLSQVHAANQAKDRQPRHVISPHGPCSTMGSSTTESGRNSRDGRQEDREGVTEGLKTRCTQEKFS